MYKRQTLQAGPSLMFITIPKVFANMGFGTAVGILFFVLVLFAAVTSSIADVYKRQGHKYNNAYQSESDLLSESPLYPNVVTF